MKAAPPLSRERFPRFPGKIPGFAASRYETCTSPRSHHDKGTPMDLRRRLLTRLGLPGIPTAAETSALAHALELIREIGARVHFGRLSCARSVASSPSSSAII